MEDDLTRERTHTDNLRRYGKQGKFVSIKNLNLHDANDANSNFGEDNFGHPKMTQSGFVQQNKDFLYPKNAHNNNNNNSGSETNNFMNNKSSNGSTFSRKDHILAATEDFVKSYQVGQFWDESS